MQRQKSLEHEDQSIKGGRELYSKGGVIGTIPDLREQSEIAELPSTTQLCDSSLMQLLGKCPGKPCKPKRNCFYRRKNASPQV